MNKPSLLACLVSSIVATGCSSNIHIPDEEKFGPLVQQTMEERPASTASFRRAITAQELLNKRDVTFAKDNVTLLEAISTQIPGSNIVPKDSNVDLTTRLTVRASNMPLKDYLEYLRAQSGYDIELTDTNTVYVRSYVTKTWNLAAFGSKRNIISSLATRSSAVLDSESSGSSTSSSSSSSSSSDTGSETAAGSKVVIEAMEDDWDLILAGARDILRVGYEGPVTEEKTSVEPNGALPQTISASSSDGTSFLFEETAKKQVTPFKAYVHGIRSTGILTASGDPQRMAILDDYIKSASKSANSQIHIDVKMYDVVLEDTAGTGVNWDVLSSGSLNGNPLNIAFSGPGGFLQGENIWGLSTTYETSKVTSKNVLNFLKQYGRVELLTQPSLTMRNGVTAFISSGEELSYVGNFVQAQDQNGNIYQTPEFSRMQVGVSLQVTARRTGEDKILLDIVPVVSSITGSDKINVLDSALEIPRTALQQLSTQVITRSGEPVHLGGLITNKIANELSGLPIRDTATGKLFKFFFDSKQNSLERRELVLFVTPKIIEGA